MGSKLGRIWSGTYELAALERLEKSPWTYNGRNVVASLVLSFLSGSSSYLQIRWTTIKAWITVNFFKIPSLIKELAVLEHLEN